MWHPGEREMQARLGMAERMAELEPRLIRPAMPEQHRVFYRMLPMLVVGAVDAAGAPWATALTGAPGFVDSLDPRTLRVRALPDVVDPVDAGLAAGAAIGCLGIDLVSRRRNRVNGRVVGRDADGFTLAVEQAFGNCPQYIQTRAPTVGPAGAGGLWRGQSLDDEARAAIRDADTMFVASYVDIDGDASRRSVDVSHRGGRPGFVRVDGDVLTIPDFSGNLQFNTLGNLVSNPRAGLVFLDFERGDVLQLTGRTELVFAGAEVEAFEGAERLWRVRVEQVVRRRGALGLRWRFGEFSPQSLATGQWS